LLPFGAEVSLSRVESAAHCLNRHHDFTELTTVLQIAVHFHHIVELEYTIDDRFERATGEPLGDVLDRDLPAFCIACHQSDAVSLDHGHFPDHLQHGKRGAILAQCAVDLGDAVEGQRGDQLGKVRATDGIEGNARAISVRDAHHFGDHVLFLCCNNMLCAGLV
jgi:hypothetical protein